MRWSCFLAINCCLVAIITSLSTTSRVDIDGAVKLIDDVITIPVGLNDDTNVVIFQISISNYNYKEAMLSNFCRLNALTYESYLLLMNYLDHQYTEYISLHSPKAEQQPEDNYDHSHIAFPVYITDYENQSRVIYFTSVVLEPHVGDDHDISSTIIEELVQSFCVRYYFSDLHCDRIYKEAIAKYVLNISQRDVDRSDQQSRILHQPLDVVMDGVIDDDHTKDDFNKQSSQSHAQSLQMEYQAKLPIYSNYFLPYSTSMLRYNHAVKAEIHRLYRPSLLDPLLLLAEEEVYSRIMESISHQHHDDNSSSTMQNRTICFLHSATMEIGTYRILMDLLELIDLSGLITTLDALYVLNYGFEISVDIINKYPSVMWFQVMNDTSYFETPSIRILQMVAQSLHHHYHQHHHQGGWENTNILYIHTKGASYRLAYDHIEDWRHLMTYFLIEKHRECLNVLNTLHYDCVGVNYTPVPAKHFSGNFWWTTASYVSELPPLKYVESGKFEPEMWLLRRADARIYVVYSSGDINHSIQRYPRQCYTQDTSLYYNASDIHSLATTTPATSDSTPVTEQYVQMIDGMSADDLCGAYFRNHLENNNSLLIL